MPKPSNMPNIRLHKKGRYEARIQRQGQSFSAYGATAVEAAGNLEEKLLQSGKLSKEWTFKSFAETCYIPTIKTLSKAYNDQVTWALTHLTPIHETPLDQINRQQLQALINTKVKTLSRNSLVHVRKVAFAVLNLAEIDEIIPSNPCKHVKLPRIVHTAKWIPSTEDIAPLVQAGATGSGYPTLILGACLGLRIGEIQALKPIHFKRKGLIKIPGTKTASADRELPLPELVFNAISGFQFPLAASSNSSARKALQRMDGRLHPHLLRHFCNTSLQELGCPPELRRRILGHNEPGVNALYSHAKQIALIRPWLNALAKLLFETQVGTNVNVEVG